MLGLWAAAFPVCSHELPAKAMAWQWHERPHSSVNAAFAWDVLMPGVASLSIHPYSAGWPMADKSSQTCSVSSHLCWTVSCLAASALGLPLVVRGTAAPPPPLQRAHKTQRPGGPLCLRGAPLANPTGLPGQQMALLSIDVNWAWSSRYLLCM